MEEYISWGIVAVLAIAIFLLAYFNKDYKKVFLDALISVVKENEAFAVQAVYNRLPSQIKDNVGSKEVARIVEYVFIELVKSLETLKK